MVDLQNISIMITAISVTIAAIYYTTTLRINQRNSKIALTTNIMQTLLTEEAQRRWIDLLNMEWTDYDDFERKYGSDVNPENYAKRASVWSTSNVLGNLLKRNMVDAETFYSSGVTYAIWIWRKFEPVIIEHRRRYSGADTYDGLEYLAGEMEKIKRKIDPNFVFPDTFTKYIPEN